MTETMDQTWLLLMAGQRVQHVMIVIAAAGLAGLARGFSGFGAALIFMPLASAAIGPQLAAPVLLITDSVTTLGLLPDAWRRSNRRDVATMSVGALAAIPAGTAILALADPLTVRWIIVGLVIAVLGLLVSGWRYRGQPNAGLTILVGALSGLFSGAAQIGGPPVVAYWLGGVLSNAIVRANIILFFAITNVIIIASYLTGGLITAPALVLCLTAGPCYAIGLQFGTRLFGWASDDLFRRVCYGLIVVAAIVGLPLLDPILR